MAAVTTPAETTRERLIAVAIEVFAAQGYDGARVQDIARGWRASPPVPSTRNYRGKAQLLFYVSSTGGQATRGTQNTRGPPGLPRREDGLGEAS